MRCLILASNQVLTLSLLRCLKGMHASAIVLADKRYGAVIASNAQQRYLAYDGRLLSESDTSLIDRINRICDRHNIDFVLPSGIGATLYLSKHQNSIRTARVSPLAQPELIATLHDKWRFAQLMATHSLPIPQSRLISSRADLERLEIGYPLIIKPLGSSGAEGVLQIDNLDRLERVIATLEEHGRLPMIAQEFIPGVEVSVSIVADRGRIVACTQQQPCPRGLTKLIADERIDEVVRKIAAAVAFHGPANFDTIIDARDQSIKVLECNPRFWATIDIAMCCGVNMSQIAMRLAGGENVESIEPLVTEMLLPECAVARLAVGKARWSQLSPGTRRAIQLAAADPLPATMQAFGRYWPRIKSRIAGTRGDPYLATARRAGRSSLSLQP